MPQFEVSGTQLDLCRVGSADVIDLRHEALREGMPREAAIFDGDAAPTARHYAAVVPGEAGGGHPRVVCCATLHLNSWEGEPAWQLRGMATAADCRGKGVGRSLLEWVEQDVQQAGPARLLWCNARVPAIPFYVGQGWETRSDVFDIPTAGPHRRLTKRLG